MISNEETIKRVIQHVKYRDEAKLESEVATDFEEASKPEFQEKIDDFKEEVSRLSESITNIENNVFFKKTTTTIDNVQAYISHNFVKGKKYSIHITTTNTTIVQVGTISEIGASEYIDSTSIFHGNIDYIWEFIASENAPLLLIYKEEVTGTTAIANAAIEEFEVMLASKESVEVINKELENVSMHNACSIYDFLGTKDNVLSCEAWTQGDGFITREHSGDLFVDAVVAQKYVTAYDRVITYDFVPYYNAIVCGFTQSANLEYFWQQGYLVSISFADKLLCIHNKYGTDNDSIPKNAPSVLKSVSFNDNSYIGKKHRLVIERNEHRGIKATLYSLIDYSILASIETDFEASTIPSYGLGYDYPAFALTCGKADLYYLGVKIKKSSKCHLYIIGDSITEGVAIEPQKAWAYMVARYCKNTIVSGRGGATIDSIIKRLEDEASVLKPKYIMVTIGTNIGNTPEKLNNVISKIEEIGAIPIINCIPRSTTSLDTATINSQILSLNTHHVRMDIATSLNYDLNSNADASLFLSDGVHLNENGYERMFKQVLIDCPFLFN